MAAKSITISEITRTNGQVYLRYGKKGLLFPSVAAFRDWVTDSDSDETLLRLAFGIWARRNPALDRPQDIVGRTITLDLSAVRPLEVV